MSLTERLSQKFSGFVNDQAEESALPQKFIDEKQTSSFVENGGGVIAINMEIMLLLWILHLLRKISFFQRNRFFKTMYESLRWNIVIRIFLENGTPLAFAILLQGQVLRLDSTYHYIVLTLMLFSSAYFIAMLVSTTRILSKRTINDLNEEGTEKKYGTLYEGIKLTDGSAKYYYLIILIRGIVITFLVTFVYSLPLLQIVILIFYNIFFVWYIFKSVVFKTRALTIICRANQILILGAEVVILCLAFETSSTLYYNILGWLISGSLLLALVLELGYLGAVQVMNIKFVWRAAKRLWSRVRSMLSKPRRLEMVQRRIRPRIQEIQRVADTSTGAILGTNTKD